MSVKATHWAWHQSPEHVRGNQLTVLLALADIADDNGVCKYADRDGRLQEALAKKARISVRTFQRVIPELEEKNLVRTSRTGRENSYVLNFDEVRPSEVIPNTRQSDVFITPEPIGDKLSSYDTVGGSDTPTVADHKDVLTKTDLNQSSVNDLTTDALALRADDEIESSRRLNAPARLRRSRAKKHLDVDELAGRVDRFFADFPAFERGKVILAVAYTILGRAAKAGTDLFDPTGYVAAAIENEPDVWRKVAFTLYARSA